MESLRISSRLFQKRNVMCTADQSQASVAVASSAGDVEDDGASPAAKKMRRYRERLKEKGLYEQYRERQREHSNTSKNSRTEEQKQADREKTRLRVQKCREKKKAKGEPLNSKPPKTTRKSLEANRKRERERKQRYRASLTPQKKAAINMKRRKAAEAKKASMIEPQPVPSTPCSPLPSSSHNGYKKSNTKSKAVSRAKSGMPKSPSKYAEVAEVIINTYSPRKRACLEAKGIHHSQIQRGNLATARYREEMQKAFEEDKMSRKKKNLQEKADFCRFFLKCNTGLKASELRKELNVSWRYLKKTLDNLHESKPARKPRSDAVSPQLINSIQDFLNRGDISREEPSARNVSTKDLLPRRYMCKTMKEAWQQFKDETKAIISYSKFCCFRPKATKTVAKDRFKTCCCEYCENISLKRKSVNIVLQANGFSDKLLGTKYSIVDMTCCAPDPVLGVHSKKCIDRECRDCGTKKFMAAMEASVNALADIPASWSEWRSERQTYKNKQGEQVTANKQVLAKVEGSFRQLISSLVENLEPFAWHMANYQWQQREFDKLTKNVPQNWLVMVMDFGENFTCMYQDEAQGAHWTRQQITVHPIVCYYQCPEHPEDTVQETFCFISDDLKHDSHAVQHFQLEVLHALQDRGLSFTKIVHFSDGCPSQYKGKTSFIDLSFALEDTGITTEKHFFGSRHGKGPCDRQIGVVKRLARLAVLRRRCVIATAHDMFQFGCDSLTRPDDGSHSHKCRQFRFVEEGSISRNRPDRTGGKGVAGTRKLHCMQGLSPFLVRFRERSCFCQACINGDGECPKAEFVGSWTEASMKTNKRQRRNDVPEVQPDNVGTADANPAIELEVNPTTDSCAASEGHSGGPADNDPELSNRSSPRVDDFVTAIFTTGRKQTETRFYAKVIEVADTEDGECLLHYLIEKDGAYVWADKAWHPTSAIKEIVAPPSLVPGRRLAFSFK